MLKQNYKRIFEGSDQFYLADPKDTTTKKNGGVRWGVAKEFSLDLDKCIQGHIDGSLNKGVVLPPIRKSDNKCKWGAIDIDGNIYKDDEFKKELLDKVENLKLPLTACFSKSKGIHLYINFTEWTDAQLVINILHTFLNKLDLPPETECFPKQAIVKDTGNGIMLPYMNGIGNDWIKSYKEKIFLTGSIEEFEDYFHTQRVNANDIEIDLPKPKAVDVEMSEADDGLTKLEILKGIKAKTINEHPTMGGKYHSWIQVVIAKCVVQGYGDNEILKLIKEVHQDNRGIGYTWPESYQKQINYTRQDNRINKPNPGDTKFLEKQTFDSALKLEELTKSYCYVMANDMFNKLGTPEFYQEKQINNYHKHEVFIEKGTLTNKLLSKRKFARAETFITSADQPPGLIHIKKPGIIPLINRGTVLNIYIPNYLTPQKGDVEFIIAFFIWLVGEEKWKIIEEWIAYMIQYPGIKMKWAVVLVSVVEGVGKGLLARLCSRILGADNVNENANYKHLTNTHNTLLIGTQLLVLNEVSLGDFKSKQEGTNTLKNFVGDDVYSCNFKNKPMVKLPNLTNFMLFSNDERVLGAPQGGRRYFFCNIKKTETDIIQKSNEGFYEKAWNFIDSDVGASALLHYFKNEVKIGDPTIFKKRAPETNDLKELIEQSKHPVQKKLEYDLNREDSMGKKIFKDTWCGLATFDWVNEELNTTRTDDLTKEKYSWGSFGDDAIYKFLSANSTPWNNGDNTRQISIRGVRQRLYNLDDTRCPIPGKSYKDLTPKQIEVIYLNYWSIYKEIRDEAPNYQKAMENIPKTKESIIDKIKTGHSYSKLYKNEDPEVVYEKLMNGTEKLGHNDQLMIEASIKQRAILKRGMRFPGTIVESYYEQQ